MRHTLLPLSERKMLRRDYYARVLTIFCFTVSIACLAGAAALFPAYLRARNLEQSELAAAAKITTSQEAKDRSAVEAELKADALVVAALSKNAGDYRASQAIQSLIDSRGTNKFFSFSFSRLGTTTAAIAVQGAATTRDELLSLKSRLMNVFPQAKIELPLSELAKSQNIDFSMKITYKLP